jgi:hypothetical protein
VDGDALPDERAAPQRVEPQRRLQERLEKSLALRCVEPLCNREIVSRKQSMKKPKL